MSSFFRTSFHVEYFKFSDEISGARLKVGVDAEEKQWKGGRHPRMTPKKILTLALKHLASSEGLKIDESRARQIAKHSSIEEDLLIWTYAWELGRRAKKTSKGSSLHSIWRRIDRDIRTDINADLVWSSRLKLLEHLRRHT